MQAELVFDDSPEEPSKICPHCGAKMVEYKHAFNAGLAAGLWRLYSYGGGEKPIKLSEIGLTHNQWDNFQKMRYWGLVAQAYRDDGTRINGAWTVTPVGIGFIERGASIQKAVWTYRGETLRFEGDAIFFNDFHDRSYDQRSDYSAGARPHAP